MSFSIPRNDLSEMVLYIWKIINLPYISYKDLLYRMCFDFSLYSPNEAKIFINNAIKNNFIIQDNNKDLKLSKDLNSKLISWQKKRKADILGNMNSFIKQIELRTKFEQHGKDKFNILLKGFTDKPTINRAVAVPETAFNLKMNKITDGLLEATVAGSKEEPYRIKINLKSKELIHNCHDFETRRAKQKKFCKHLVRLFLLLKEEDNETATKILRNITENIEKWDFSN